jgi:serine/threonine protein phosphatase PrpC
LAESPIEIATVQKTKRSTILKSWGNSDPGKRRENNEDRIFCEPERGIFVVADGLGGESAGEIAAQQAIDSIKNRLHQETGTVAWRLKEAIAGANNEIYRLAGRNPSWRGMACVLTATLFEDGVLHIGHVGDSRLYKIRNREIRKITSDHSPVGEREDAGELSEVAAMNHPRRNEVFRDVGSQLHTPDDPEFVQYLQIPFEEDAAAVLCSDGLSDMLTSGEIIQTVIECAGDPQDTVSRLIQKANAAGGRDNVSVIVVEGRDFAAAMKNVKTSGIARSDDALTKSFLRGRWGFFCYGLILGILALFAFSLWNYLNKTPIEQPVVHELPRVLQVDPYSVEFPTISKALDAARGGDRIEVGDGNYEESIRLKERVDLIARVPGRAVIHITRSIPGADAAAVAENVKEASISGIAVQSEPEAQLSYGIRLFNSDVSISNVEVSGAVRAGILVDGNSVGTIAGCYVHGNVGPGFLIAGQASPFLAGNVVYANGIAREHKNPGLYVTGNSNPEVKRNVFSGNGAEAIRLQAAGLKERMLDNLFIGPGKVKVVVSR